MQESTVMVLPEGADVGRSEETSLGLVSQIHVDNSLSIEELRSSLDSQMAVKVLAFFDAARSFGGFTDRDWASSVAKRLARLSSVWCCASTDPAWKGYGMEAGVSKLMCAKKQVS